jgi:hypothetical protein
MTRASSAAAIGVFTLLLVSGSPAPAQFMGNRGGTFIGAGSTPIGDIDRGIGIMAQGIGVGNYYNAMADSIGTDTWMRLNEYLFQSVREASMREQKRLAARIAKNKENYNESIARVLNAPEFKDIRRGSALNAVYNELTRPQITETTFRLSPVHLSSEQIRNIPFFYAKEDLAFSLRRLTARGNWPVGLRDERLAPERRTYERAVDNALELQLEGKLTRAAVDAVEEAVSSLSIRLDQVITPSRDKVYLEARDFVKRLETSKELFKRREIEQILGEIDKYSGTTVHDLVVFMKRNNLRFGVPDEIGDEQSLYTQLYASLRQQLDLVQIPEDASKK